MELFKDFDYVFRIDEDCLIQKFDKNQFDIMFNNEITFVFLDTLLKHTNIQINTY